MSANRLETKLAAEDYEALARLPARLIEWISEVGQPTADKLVDAGFVTVIPMVGYLLVSPAGAWEMILFRQVAKERDRGVDRG